MNANLVEESVILFEGKANHVEVSGVSFEVIVRTFEVIAGYVEGNDDPVEGIAGLFEGFASRFEEVAYSTIRIRWPHRTCRKPLHTSLSAVENDHPHRGQVIQPFLRSATSMIG